MLIDLHVHTRHYSGCSAIEPEDLIPRAGAVGLDGLVLTEHGILWPEEKLAPFRDLAAEHDLVLLAGQEVTCLEQGRRQDFLIFGIDRSLGSCPSARELIELVHSEGGVVIAAHPFKPSRLGVGYHGAGDEIYHLDLDAVELFHPDHSPEARSKVQKAAALKGLPMTGGSDAHELCQLGTNWTRFEQRVEKIEDLMDQIKKGRITPENKMKGGSGGFSAPRQGQNISK